jgi:hypothetical protein
LNELLNHSYYLIIEFYSRGFGNKFKKWLKLFLDLIIEIWYKGRQFNCLSDDIPAFIDHNVILITLLMACFKFSQYSLDDTLNKHHNVPSNESMIELYKVLQEVEVENYADL